MVKLGANDSELSSKDSEVNGTALICELLLANKNGILPLRHTYTLLQFLCFWAIARKLKGMRDTPTRKINI